MCGIVGLLVGGGLDDGDRREVAALAELMARRGPDDAGAWDDGAHLALGFRRLALVDLSPGGHQPMEAADGRSVLVFNGEIYNYRELRRELEAAGRRFRSTSDTEVVLQALEVWGIDALARFNGMFALGWYRVEGRTLLLARDPVGIKPLCWWQGDGAFAFGSQYDQVVRHRRCDRSKVDAAALGLYLRLGYLPAPFGVIEGTGQVEPGCWLQVRAGGTPTTGRFRSMAPVPPPEERLRGDAALEAVDAAVGEAVARQQHADVPVGVFLSGGVDSPLVAAHVARGAEPVRAYSIGTDEAKTDESTAATAFARHLGLEHHLRTITGPRALALVDEVRRANTEPFGDYSSLPTLMVAALAAEHDKAVLSGDGGDELFWGYPRFARVRAARRWFRYPTAVRRAAYYGSKPLPNARRPRAGITFPTLGDWYQDAHSGLRDHDLGQFAPELRAVPPTDLFELEGLPTDDELLQWMRRNELRCHLPMVLQKVDRASMHHSLEVRVPLLDLEVVDLAARVDPSAALDGEVGKVVLRRALARRAPAELAALPKKGFTVPMARWMREELRPLVEDLLLGPSAFPAGAFDAAALERWYGQHLRGERNHGPGLWNLLALQLWADEHLRPLPVPPKSAGAPV
ncbi:MAG: asparagine synthase (glutamine-hydrolyzing) [Acidimicrobiales bacterium]